MVDNTAPTVTSIERQTPSTSPTSSDTLKWRVTFGEDVQNVDQADFEVSGTSATLTVSAVSGSESQYDVTASGGDLTNYDGTVTLSFASGHNIEDLAGNALTNTTPSGTNDDHYVVDNTAPTVVSATINGATLVITFSEDLKTSGILLNISAFTVEKDVGGTDTEQTLVGTPLISGRTVTLYLGGVVSSTDSGIKVSYARPSSASNRIQDLVGHPAANFTDQDVTNITGTTDTTAPTVTSIVRQDPETSPTNSDTLKWRVTFSEDVQNVDAADFGVSNTTATLTVAAVTGSESQYDVTASGGNLADRNHTVTLSIRSGHNITDKAATPNALTNRTPGSNESYVVDNTAPTVTSIERQDPTTSPTNADSITWRITFSEPVDAMTIGGNDFFLTGRPSQNTQTAFLAVSGSGDTQFDFGLEGSGLENHNRTITLSFVSNPDIRDRAGNALASTTPTGANDNTFVMDNTLPTVVSAAIDGASLVITLNEDLRTTNIPANSAFTVRKDVGGITHRADPHRHAHGGHQDRDPDPADRGEPYRHRHHGELRPAVLAR